jgi:GNAT superfamily N-acetyltransferase
MELFFQALSLYIAGLVVMANSHNQTRRRFPMMIPNPVCPEPLHIRGARIEDIDGIVALIGKCGPYLSTYVPYLFFVYAHCFGDTCLVAVEGTSIMGFCSVLPVGNGSYYLHQLGVVPEARGIGIAFQLWACLLTKLHARHGDDFRLEFTTDRKNKAVHRLNRKVAESFGLCLQKLPDIVPPLQDGCDEDLYEMTPICLLDVRVISVAA